MERKNRYEYILLRDTREFLMNARFRNREQQDKAQRILSRIHEFLCLEGYPAIIENVDVNQDNIVSQPVPRDWVSSIPEPSYVLNPSVTLTSWPNANTSVCVPSSVTSSPYTQGTDQGTICSTSVNPPFFSEPLRPLRRSVSIYESHHGLVQTIPEE